MAGEEPDTVFARERCEDVIADLPILLAIHAEEADDWSDKPDPDYEAYARLEALGALRIYTVRRNARLVGYAVYILANHLHYRGLRTAHQSLLFLHPDVRARGMPRRFIAFTEGDLWEHGVNVITQSVPCHAARSGSMRRMFEALEYEGLETTFFKRKAS